LKIGEIKRFKDVDVLREGLCQFEEQRNASGERKIEIREVSELTGIFNVQSASWRLMVRNICFPIRLARRKHLFGG